MFHKHKTKIALLLIILLAAFLRLYRISDYMTFLGDEGRDALAVLDILRGNLVFLGPRSSAADFYYGPVYFYMITPFMWLFNYDPVGPAVFIALVGIATVCLVYIVGKKFFSEEAGLCAAALYTVSPLVIGYSRSSWNPNPLPFVSLLSLLVVYKAVQTNSWKLFLLLGFLLGIAIQLQYLALFLIVIILLFICIGSFSKEGFGGKITFQSVKLWIFATVKQYLILFFGFLIGWLPFLAFELKNNFLNFRAIGNFILHGDGNQIYPEGMGFWQNIWSVFFKLFGRLITRFPPPEQIILNNGLHIQLWQIGTVLLGLLAVIALFKIKNKLTVSLFFLWLFVGCFLFGFYKKEIFDYYLGFMFPLPFLLVGNLLGSIWNFCHSGKRVERAQPESGSGRFWPSQNDRRNLIGKIFVLVVFVSLFLFNLDASPFKYAPNRQKDQVKQIAEFVLSKIGSKPYNFALLTLGNSDHGYRYFFEINHRPPVTILNKDIDPNRTSVTDQLLVICEDPNCQPLGASLWEVAGFGRAEIAGEWNVSVVRVYRLVHYKE